MAWAINPHMQVGAVCGRSAVRQHARFVRALEAAGAEVVALPFVHGAFDSVFSKDNAIVVARERRTEAFLAHPRHPERRPEQRARAAALEALGVHVQGTARVPFEGGDTVMLPHGQGAFLGHGFRSSAGAARELERFLDALVVPLELQDPRLYHLDMALTVLEDGTALYCAEALGARSLQRIASHPSVRAMVRVPLEEALAFGVNLVAVDRSIVWGASAPRTTRALEELGYRVHRTPLDQFHLAGGSAACLVSRVHVGGAAMRGAPEEEAPQSTAA